MANEFTPGETLEERFRRLAAAWQDEVAHHSSSTIRIANSNYREIVSLGSDVVPLLIRDMEEHHTHWFSALSEITGANPIPQSAAGNIPQMIQAWLAWWRCKASRS